MLDKNPEIILDDNLENIYNEFKKNVPSLILCSNSFDKIEFLNKLIISVEDPIIFVDMDLLYSGYIESKMIQKKENLVIFQPNKLNWQQKLLEIISKISKNQFLIIIDSFNGIYNLFDDLESTRFVNSCIMLLSSLGKQANSTILITVMARKKENSEWILSPGGKQIMQSGKTGIYFLKKNQSELVISSIDQKLN
ncbi:MAG: hypothetical protein MT334_05900 [Candidatus Nitrosopumilus limneticus]|nr:hypothetical protein [Candidatus Nitrosopumilus limneticus]MSS86425.1 hypothetical protein [Nitrosopumilus sp.]PHY04147.1 MAG: hypothetical protein CK526_04160 [Nitrososphaerota archaeon]MDC4214147.1 hypothetical protein [Candidatus Nitrosopumilus limneticus]MDC4214456.1 hypothetical protein [Candidatus Nitrosopumilus limneticus]